MSTAVCSKAADSTARRSFERSTLGRERCCARSTLDDRYFAEGLAAVGDRLIQLTWHEQTAFVYQMNDFSQVGTFSYDTEGWGLCDDGSRLVMSDGTSTLYFRDREHVRAARNGRGGERG